MLKRKNKNKNINYPNNQNHNHPNPNDINIVSPLSALESRKVLYFQKINTLNDINTFGSQPVIVYKKVAKNNGSNQNSKSPYHLNQKKEKCTKNANNKYNIEETSGTQKKLQKFNSSSNISNCVNNNQNKNVKIKKTKSCTGNIILIEQNKKAKEEKEKIKNINEQKLFSRTVRESNMRPVFPKNKNKQFNLTKNGFNPLKHTNSLHENFENNEKMVNLNYNNKENTKENSKEKENSKKNTEEKENENNEFSKEKEIKKNLIMNQLVENAVAIEIKKYKNTKNKNTTEFKNIKKREYLQENGINTSIEVIDIKENENEKEKEKQQNVQGNENNVNNNNSGNKNSNQEKSKKKQLNIQKNNFISNEDMIANPHNNIQYIHPFQNNNNNNNNINNSNKNKKINKPSIQQFEFLQKIKEEKKKLISAYKNDINHYHQYNNYMIENENYNYNNMYNNTHNNKSNQVPHIFPHHQNQIRQQQKINKFQHQKQQMQITDTFRKKNMKIYEEKKTNEKNENESVSSYSLEDKRNHRSTREIYEYLKEKKMKYKQDEETKQLEKNKKLFLRFKNLYNLNMKDYTDMTRTFRHQLEINNYNYTNRQKKFRSSNNKINSNLVEERKDDKDKNLYQLYNKYPNNCSSYININKINCNKLNDNNNINNFNNNNNIRKKKELNEFYIGNESTLRNNNNNSTVVDANEYYLNVLESQQLLVNSKLKKINNETDTNNNNESDINYNGNENGMSQEGEAEADRDELEMVSAIKNTENLENNNYNTDVNNIGKKSNNLILNALCVSKEQIKKITDKEKSKTRSSGSKKSKSEEILNTSSIEELKQKINMTLKRANLFFAKNTIENTNSGYKQNENLNENILLNNFTDFSNTNSNINNNNNNLNINNSNNDTTNTGNINVQVDYDDTKNDMNENDMKYGEEKGKEILRKINNLKKEEEKNVEEDYEEVINSKINSLSNCLNNNINNLNYYSNINNNKSNSTNKNNNNNIIKIIDNINIEENIYNPKKNNDKNNINNLHNNNINHINNINNININNINNLIINSEKTEDYSKEKDKILTSLSHTYTANSNPNKKIEIGIEPRAVLNLVEIIKFIIQRKTFVTLYESYINHAIFQQYNIAFSFFVAICKQYPFKKLEEYYNYKTYNYAFRQLFRPFNRKNFKYFLECFHTKKKVEYLVILLTKMIKFKTLERIFMYGEYYQEDDEEKAFKMIIMKIMYTLIKPHLIQAFNTFKINLNANLSSQENQNNTSNNKEESEVNFNISDDDDNLNNNLNNSDIKNDNINDNMNEEVFNEKENKKKSEIENNFFTTSLKEIERKTENENIINSNNNSDSKNNFNNKKEKETENNTIDDIYGNGYNEEDGYSNNENDNLENERRKNDSSIKMNSFLYESLDSEDKSSISVEPNSVDNDKLHQLKMLLMAKNKNFENGIDDNYINNLDNEINEDVDINGEFNNNLNNNSNINNDINNNEDNSGIKSEKKGKEGTKNFSDIFEEKNNINNNSHTNSLQKTPLEDNIDNLKKTLSSNNSQIQNQNQNQNQKQTMNIHIKEYENSNDSNSNNSVNYANSGSRSVHSANDGNNKANISSTSKNIDKDKNENNNDDKNKINDNNYNYANNNTSNNNETKDTKEITDDSNILNINNNTNNKSTKGSDVKTNEKNNSENKINNTINLKNTNNIIIPNILLNNNNHNNLNKKNNNINNNINNSNSNSQSNINSEDEKENNNIINSNNINNSKNNNKKHMIEVEYGIPRNNLKSKLLKNYKIIEKTGEENVEIKEINEEAKNNDNECNIIDKIFKSENKKIKIPLIKIINDSNDSTSENKYSSKEESKDSNSKNNSDNNNNNNSHSDKFNNIYENKENFADELVNEIMEKILVSEIKSTKVKMLPNKKYKFEKFLKKTNNNNNSSQSQNNSLNNSCNSAGTLRDSHKSNSSGINHLSLHEDLFSLNDSLNSNYSVYSVFNKTIKDKKKEHSLSLYFNNICPKLISYLHKEIIKKYPKIYENISSQKKNISEKLMISLVLQDAQMLRSNYKKINYKEPLDKIIDKKEILKNFSSINKKIRQEDNITSDNYYDNMMNECVLETALELIERERFYGENGEPLKWSSRTREISFKYTKNDGKKFADNICKNILKIIHNRIGLINDNYSYMNQDELNYEREKRLLDTIKNDLNKNECQWKNLEMEETQLKVESTEMILDQLYNEVIEILEHIQFNRISPELYQFKSIYACEEIPKLSFQQTTTEDVGMPEGEENDFMNI